MKWEVQKWQVLSLLKKSQRNQLKKQVEKPEPRKEKPVEKTAEKSIKKEEPEQPKNTRIERPTTAGKRPPPVVNNTQLVDSKVKTAGGPTGIILEKDNKDRDEEETDKEKPQAESVKVGDVDPTQHSKFVQDAMNQASKDQAQPQNNQPVQPGATGQRLGKIGAKRADQSKPVVGQVSATGAANKENVPANTSTPSNDIELVQKVIQSLTQNTNPLKKSLDFVNDDIESMNKEMDFWKKEYLNSKARLQSELKGTEESLQPLQDKLAEIEEQIKDKKAKIQNVKSQIIQNQTTIKNLLYSVVSSK